VEAGILEEAADCREGGGVLQEAKIRRELAAAGRSGLGEATTRTEGGGEGGVRQRRGRSAYT
jgi:hypothetical protein